MGNCNEINENIYITNGGYESQNTCPTQPNIIENVIIEPNGTDFISITACTGVVTNHIYSCSGDSEIHLLSGVTVFTMPISTLTVSADTYYSGGTPLIDVINGLDKYVVSGSNTGYLLRYYRSDGVDIDVDLTSFANLLSADTFTTGATLIDKTVYFDRNDQLSAYTANLNTLAYQSDLTTHTADTSVHHTITELDGLYVNITGGTMSGGLITPSISAITISGDTILSGGTNLLNIFALTGSDTNTFTTASTFDNKTIYFDRNDSLSAYSVSLSALTYQTDFANHTGDTNNPHYVTTTQISAVTIIDFVSHTGDTTIHYPLSSITLSIIGDSAHTHPISAVINLQTSLDSKTDNINFTAHTADTSVHHTLIDLDSRYVNVTGDIITGGLTVVSGLTVGQTIGSGDLLVYGNLTLFGQAISAFTSELYIEDNNVYINYNPTGSTTSASIGAGWTIQDGSGTSGSSVNLDIRTMQTLTGLTASNVPDISEYTALNGYANRGFVTQLNDIVIRSSDVTTPNGVRVIAEWDVLDGGSF
jgi:hypothetical protein